MDKADVFNLMPRLRDPTGETSKQNRRGLDLGGSDKVKYRMC